MRSIILMLSVCSLLFITNVAQAGLPEADAMLTRAAAFQQWGERLYRKGDITAAEAAFYEAGKLEAEAAELELVEVDQRAYPVIQQLSLIVEERFDRLGEAQTEVGYRLQALEQKLTKRLESSGEGLRIDLDDLSGNLEDLSSEARKALGKLQSEFTELTDQLFSDRDSDRDDDDEDHGDRDKRRRRERESSDRDRRDPSDHGRRMHIHAAMQNLNAPPIHHHMRESIEHLYAAGLHEAAEQLERALDAAREQVKEALRDSGGHDRGHHAHRSGDRDGDEAHHSHHADHHSHHSGPDRAWDYNTPLNEYLQRLNQQVRELNERVERLENATRKKRKSRDDD